MFTTDASSFASTPKQQSIVLIAALTAQGDLESLAPALDILFKLTSKYDLFKSIQNCYNYILILASLL
ncbi:hypothetical protein A9G13_05180 [Gilliamella sp. wkB178]|nr:hypothetical protein A9G13_05180 [Gilliamella apicola]